MGRAALGLMPRLQAPKKRLAEQLWADRYQQNRSGPTGTSTDAQGRQEPASRSGPAELNLGQLPRLHAQSGETGM